MASFIFWALAAVVAIAPLPLGSNRPWAWSLIAVTVGVLVGLWALAAARNAAFAPIGWRRHGFVTVPFLCLAAWFLLQTVTFVPNGLLDPLWGEASVALGRPLSGAISLDPVASRDGAMRFLAYGGVFWLAMQLGYDAKLARRLFWTIAIAGFVYAVYGLFIQLGNYHTVLWFPKWAYDDSLTSTFVNRNSYAAYAGVGLIVVLALLVQVLRENGTYQLMSQTDFIYFAESVTPGFFFLSVASLVLATALVLSQSRGGLAFTCLGVGVLVTALAAARAIRFAAAGVLGVVLLAAGIFVVTYSGERLMGRFIETEQSGGAPGREVVHGLAWRAIEDGPVVGRGLDTFTHVFQLYRDANTPWPVPTHDKAHSLYLEMAVEGGPIALAILLAMSAGLIAVLVRGVLVRRRRVIYPCVGLATTALLGGHAIIDFSIQIPAIAVTFAALLGVGFAQSFNTHTARHERNRGDGSDLTDEPSGAPVALPKPRASGPAKVGAQEIPHERGIALEHRPHGG